MSDFNNGYARPLPQTADMSVDAGLRSFMLGVYNKLALGLVVAGVLAYVTGNVPAVQQLLFAVGPDGRIGLTVLGMIVQFSTGGRGRDQAARGSALYLRPDMASLSTGSVNFPTIVYENSPALVVDLATRMKENAVLPEIEVFDLSHLHGARRLVDAGLMSERPHVQFVMGVKNAMPAEEHLLDILLAELKRVLPKATWTAAGIGRHQSQVMRWVLERGGDGVRTGLEDNIRITKDRLAGSNAELVKVAVDLCAEYDVRPATPVEARSMLGLAA